MDGTDKIDGVGLHEPAHWGFWGTIVWGVVISVIFIVLQSVTILVVVVSDKNLTEAEIEKLFLSSGQDGFILSLATLVTTILGIGLIVGVIKLRRGSVLRDYLGVRLISYRAALKWFGFLIGFIALSDLITTLLGRPVVPDFMSAVYATADPVWMIWLALIVAAPLFEETFFRGFLFKGFELSFMGPVGAVLVTAGLWALIHAQYDAYGIATVFCLGLLLGTARVMSGSLLLPIGLHAVSNLVATIEAAVLG